MQYFCIFFVYCVYMCRKVIRKDVDNFRSQPENCERSLRNRKGSGLVNFDQILNSQYQSPKNESTCMENIELDLNRRNRHCCF
jgi:hypothetical protein